MYQACNFLERSGNFEKLKCWPPCNIYFYLTVKNIKHINRVRRVLKNPWKSLILTEIWKIRSLGFLKQTLIFKFFRKHKLHICHDECKKIIIIIIIYQLEKEYISISATFHKFICILKTGSENASNIKVSHSKFSNSGTSLGKT